MDRWLERSFWREMTRFYVKLSLLKSEGGQPSKGFDGTQIKKVFNGIIISAFIQKETKVFLKFIL